MKPVVDGLVTDVGVACSPQITPHYICGGCSVATAGRQDNKSALLPGGGGPGSSIVLSFCHTFGVGKAVSQLFNGRVAHYKTSGNFPHCCSIIQRPSASPSHRLIN